MKRLLVSCCLALIALPASAQYYDMKDVKLPAGSYLYMGVRPGDVPHEVRIEHDGKVKWSKPATKAISEDPEANKIVYDVTASVAENKPIDKPPSNHLPPFLRAQYQRIVDQGDPYDNAVKYFNQRKIGMTKRIVFALGSTRPSTLEDFLQTELYRQQRLRYDNARDKLFNDLISAGSR